MTSPSARAGSVAGDSGKKQHQDLYRKVLLRRRLLSASEPGPAYVPFCGEGDLAVELYPDRPIYAADLDAGRVATFQARRPDADVRVADCDGWPFDGIDVPFAVADLDAYNNPYRALAAFWANARTTTRVVIFGTDGMRMPIHGFTGKDHLLDVSAFPEVELGRGAQNERRAQYSGWWARTVHPWIEALIAPAVIVDEAFYQRVSMIYWGIVVDRSGVRGDAPPPDRSDEKVEAALYEAALSGNVPAALAWLGKRQPERWGDRREAAAVTTARNLAAELGYTDED
jgi:hypothetical protein